MPGLAQLKLVDGALSPAFVTLFQSLMLSPGQFIAGGAVRDAMNGVEPTDIDVYGTPVIPRKLPCLSPFAELALDEFLLCEKIRIPVQEHGNIRGSSIREVLLSFDLQCCQVAWTPSCGNGVMVLPGDFSKDNNVLNQIERRQLMIADPSHPVSTCVRVLRLIGRGWTISPEEATRLCELAGDRRSGGKDDPLLCKEPKCQTIEEDPGMGLCEEHQIERMEKDGISGSGG